MSKAKYDIFISFKNSDDLVHAKDRDLAEKYYNLLKDKGFKVFFSPVSIDEEGADNWRKAIDHGVDTCDVLIVIGCSKENLESEWVRYEWERFQGRIKNGENGSALRLYVVYSGITTRDIPSELASEQQAYDDKELDTFDKLYKSIYARFSDDKKSALYIKNAEEYIKRARQKIIFGYGHLYDPDLLKAKEIIDKFDNESADKARLLNEISNIKKEYENFQKIYDSNSGVKTSEPELSEGVLNNISRDVVKGKAERKFYFDLGATLMIPLAFIYLLVFIFLQPIEYFSIKNFNSPDINGLVFWGFWIILLIIFVAICFARYMILKYRSLPSEINLPSFIVSKSENSEGGKLLDRVEMKKQLEEFFYHTFVKDKYAFIVGKSGSGKSLLVDDYENKYGNIVRRFKAGDYINESKFKGTLEKIIKNNEDERRIIIFDQFERAFKDKEIFNSIRKFLLYLRKTKNRRVSVAFVCTTEIYSEINEDFEFSIKKEIKGDNVQLEFDTKFIKFTDEEMAPIMEQLLSDPKLANYQTYFEGILDDLIKNNAAMIDLNIARVFFIRQDIDDGMKLKTQNYSNSRDLIWDEYFEQVFAKLESPEQALVILYAICKYPDGLTIKDFQNLTFVHKDNLIKDKGVLKTLKELNIIEEVIKIGGDVSYIMTHDRLIEYLEIHCKGKLFEKVTQNIDFYCKEKEKKEHKKASSLSYYYENTINNQNSSKWVSGCMVLLYVSLFVTSVWLVFKGYGTKVLFGWEYKWDRTLHLMTVAAIFMAIYYIYHYLQYFAKIFFSRKKSIEFWLCVLLIVWGMISVNLALIFNGLFAVWLAVEWLFIGVLHIVLSYNSFLKENNRNLMRSEGRLYVYISLVLIGFNVGILWLAGPNVHEMILKYLGIPMFTLFTFDLIRRHVQRDWMLSKIGTFVNVSMKEKENNT